MKVEDIAARLGVQLDRMPGRDVGAVDINGVAALAEATTGDLTFLSDAKYAPLLEQTEATAAIVKPDTAVPERVIALRVADPRMAFAKAIEWFYQPFRQPAGAHPTAAIAEEVSLGADVSIGANAVVMAGVTIGDRVQIHPNVTLYPDVMVGADSIVLANCVLHERTQVGERCIIHSGTSIGDDGFGYVPQADGSWYRMLQAGRVVLEDGVEIGANVAIDRPAVGETRIGAGTKIDNLVQLGHGVQIGPNTLLCAQVGIAGGTKLGRNVLLAGQVGVVDHLELGDRVMAAAQTGISSDVPTGTVVGGYPHQTARDWKRTVAVQRRLPDLSATVRKLQKRLEQIEDKLG